MLHVTGRMLLTKQNTIFTFFFLFFLQYFRGKKQQLRQTALTSLTVYSYNTVCVITGSTSVCTTSGCCIKGRTCSVGGNCPETGADFHYGAYIFHFLSFFFFLLYRLHSQIDRACHLLIKGPTVYILYIDVRFISYIPNATIYIIEWYYMYIF